MRDDEQRRGTVLIGSGYIADRHATSLNAIGIPIAGVWSPHSERAAAAARRWGTEAAADVEELLARPGVTHVHVCTPTTSHAAYIDLAIARGLIPVAEKPLSTDAATASRLAGEVRRTGLPNYVTFNRRYDDGIRLFREIVADGRIGRPVAVYGSYQQEWNAPVSTRDWRFDPAQVGPSRVVSEIGSHWFDLAAFVLAEEVVRVCSVLTSMGERAYRQDGVEGRFTPENEDAFASLLEFGGGAVGSVLATQLAHGAWDDITLRVDGTAGSIAWTSAAPNQVALLVKGRGRQAWGDRGPTRSIETMVADIYTGDDPICADFAAGARNCAVQDAVLASADEHAWIDVEVAP